MCNTDSNNFITIDREFVNRDQNSYLYEVY